MHITDQGHIKPQVFQAEYSNSISILFGTVSSKYKQYNVALKDFIDMALTKLYDGIVNGIILQ